MTVLAALFLILGVFLVASAVATSGTQTVEAVLGGGSIMLACYCLRGDL